MDIKIPTFEFSLERQFHCLRHFSFEDSTQLNFLQNNFKAYQAKEIKEQLDLVGSKFNSAFADQPIKILDSLAKASFTERDIEKGKKVFQFTFPLRDFPRGIGNSALIPLTKLSAQQSAKKYKVNRSNYEVWTCDVEELPVTNLLTIIADISEITSQIVTLFPGEYAPAFPMGMGDFEKGNRGFWEGHCLLSKNSTNLIP